MSLVLLYELMKVFIRVLLSSYFIFRLMLTIQMYISGKDEESLHLRRVLVRRALLMLTLLLRSITKPIRRRFPTLQDLVNEGIYDNSGLILPKLYIVHSFDNNQE
jgi:hypothetical protein